MANDENRNDYDIIKSMDVGEKIKFFRRKAKLTQKELSEKLSSYNANCICLLETNKRSPSLKVLVEIADVLNIDLAYFALDNLSLGEKIEYLREYYGYTQLEFAKKIKITNDQLSRIESDLVEPSSITITNIAKTLNMSVSDLYDFTLDSTLRKKSYAFTGERIRYYRKRAKMTQKELGEKVGVSSYYISLFELRKRLPDEYMLKRIANALEQDIDKL